MAHLKKTTELVPFTPGGLNKSSKQLAIRGAEAGATDCVPHLSLDQVRSIANAATGRHAERDIQRLGVKPIFGRTFPRFEIPPAVKGVHTKRRGLR